MIAVSKDVAPLKPMSTHLRTATSDLIPGVRKAQYYYDGFFTDNP